MRPPEKELSSEAKGYPGHTALYSGNPRRGRSRRFWKRPAFCAQVRPGECLDGWRGLADEAAKSPNAVPFLELAMKALPDDTSLNLLYRGGPGGSRACRAWGGGDARNFSKASGNLDVQLELALLLVRTKIRGSPENSRFHPRKPAQYSCRYYHAKALVGMDKRRRPYPTCARRLKRACPALWRPWPRARLSLRAGR